MDIVQFLTSAFFSFTDYARTSMQRSLGSANVDAGGSYRVNEPESQSIRLEAKDTFSTIGNSTELHSLQELDLVLPQVCEAIVLITQCLISILLAEEPAQSHTSSTALRAVQHIDDRPTKNYLVTATHTLGLVESLIGT